jgi:hypothetical protein
MNLNNILDRLGSTSDDELANKLENVLLQVLPELSEISKRPKAIEILNHISKRVRPNRSMTFSCIDLVKLAADQRASTFTRNFASAFLEIGATRVPTVLERGELGCACLGAIDSTRLSTTESTLCAVVMHLIESLPNAVGSGIPLADGPVDLSQPLDFLLDLLLMAPMRHEHVKLLLSSGALASPVPPGLSPQRVRRLAGKMLADDDDTFVASWSTMVCCRAQANPVY